MQKTYLYYESENPGFIRITACSTQLDLPRFMDAKFMSKDSIDSTNTTRVVLQELEKTIIKETGERPCTRDMLEGTSYDLAKNCFGAQRHFGFLPQGNWPITNETQDARKARIEEINKRNETLHERLFPIYKRYVEKNKC